MDFIQSVVFSSHWNYGLNPFGEVDPSKWGHTFFTNGISHLANFQGTSAKPIQNSISVIYELKIIMQSRSVWMIVLQEFWWDRARDIPIFFRWVSIFSVG